MRIFTNSTSNTQHIYKGFSLAEMVLVIGIFALIAAAAMPLGLRQLNTTRAKSEAVSMVSIISLAQNNANAGIGDSNWGVFFETDSYTLYSGDTCCGTDATEYTFENGSYIESVSLTTDDSVEFVSESLKPNSYGDIVINENGITKTISINSEGLIYIQ